jgi:hypothetical protein
MKTLNVSLDYKRPEPKTEEDKKAWKSDAELTQDYIAYAVTQTYKDGLEGQLRRLYGRIQRKLDACLDENKPGMELEEAELDFLDKAFSTAKFPVSIAKYVLVLEAELDRVKRTE